MKLRSSFTDNFFRTSASLEVIIAHSVKIMLPDMSLQGRIRHDFSEFIIQGVIRIRVPVAREITTSLASSSNAYYRGSLV